MRGGRRSTRPAQSDRVADADDALWAWANDDTPKASLDIATPEGRANRERVQNLLTEFDTLELYEFMAVLGLVPPIKRAAPEDVGRNLLDPRHYHQRLYGLTDGQFDEIEAALNADDLDRAVELLDKYSPRK